MRISIDPTDPAFIDARPRRVWVNDAEVHGWIVADEFRRCAITATGIINGAVRIERLDEPGAPAAEAPAEASTSLAGMFVPVVDAAPAVEVVEATAPSFAVPTVPVTVKLPVKSTKKKRAR